MVYHDPITPTLSFAEANAPVTFPSVTLKSIAMNVIKTILEKSTKTKHDTFMLTLIESSVVKVGVMSVIKRNSYHLVVAEDIAKDTAVDFDIDLFVIETREFLTEQGETKFATFIKLK